MDLVLVGTIVSASSALVATIALVVTLRQTFLLSRQTKLLSEQNEKLILQFRSDHERSRREKAVDLLVLWSESLQRENSSARKFAEQLDEVQTRKLWDLEAPLVVDARAGNLALAALLSPVGCASLPDGRYELNAQAVEAIRWQVVRYLNMLESVLAAWRHNVADRDVLQEQFSFLYDGRKGYAGCALFRRTAGGVDAYPAIEEFVDSLKLKSQGTAGKPLIVAPPAGP